MMLLAWYNTTTQKQCFVIVILILYEINFILLFLKTQTSSEITEN